MYKHAFLTLAVAMATASAFERATGYYHNTADDGGMDAHYGYQMPLVAAAPYYDNGHHDAGLVYAPSYHNDAQHSTHHNIHKRSPGFLILGKTALKAKGTAALVGAPLFGAKALAGLKAAPVAALGGPAFVTKTGLKTAGLASLGGAALLGKTALLGVPALGLGATGLALGIPLKKAAAAGAGFKSAKFVGAKVLVG